MIFWKMSGAGNDFIMVDSREVENETALKKDFIASICRRGLSVGADGLIELKNSESHAFRMIYYNSDGGRADMCGNGARCICRFAQMFGIVSIGEEFQFESDAGIHRGLVTGNSEARIWMTEPVLHFAERTLSAGGTEFPAGFADTGVPHIVVFTDNIENGTFERCAHLLRFHPALDDAGANVNFIKVVEDGSLLMRTFERGVEGETLACGTGAVASALIAMERFNQVNLPVRIKVRSGLFLTVGRDDNGWWLQGQAKQIYRGELIP